MKKFLKAMLALTLALGLAACSSNEEETTTTETEETAEIGAVKILCPTGAPGISLASVYEEINEAGGSITFVEGATELQAQLTAEDSEYDVIIAPINLGCKLISAGMTTYKLQGAVTWGNLYLVGTSEDALQGEGELPIFGEGSVPGKIFETVSEKIDTTLTPTYYAEASLVQQQLLSGNAQVGMLAEPAATATIAKAKEAGIELSIIADLQEIYGGDGYPQAAVFVKDGYTNDALFAAMDEFTNNGYENLETLLDTIGIDNFGLPSTAIVVKSIDRQNIHYVNAADCTEDITNFLSIFGITYSDDMLA